MAGGLGPVAICRLHRLDPELLDRDRQEREHRDGHEQTGEAHQPADDQYAYCDDRRMQLHCARHD